jgi:hypothetical protein
MKFLRFYIIALTCSLYTFTIGIFSCKARKLIYTIAAYFGFSTKLKPVIPTQAYIEKSTINLFQFDSVDGNISLHELTIICSLVKQFNPRAIFEIGTFDGRTTLNMALNVDPATKIFTLDLPKDLADKTHYNLASFENVYVNKPRSGARFLDTAVSERITQLYGDSATFDFTAYNNQIDFVFIDGSHAYDYVKSDTIQAHKLLRGGKGILIWHDYGKWDGVTQFLNEKYATDALYKNLVFVDQTSLVYLVL